MLQWCCIFIPFELFKKSQVPGLASRPLLCSRLLWGRRRSVGPFHSGGACQDRCLSGKQRNAGYCYYNSPLSTQMVEHPKYLTSGGLKSQTCDVKQVFDQMLRPGSRNLFLYQACWVRARGVVYSSAWLKLQPSAPLSCQHSGSCAAP